MEIKQKAFQIDKKDHVATVLSDIMPGVVNLLGDVRDKEVIAVMKIPKGHKIALMDIEAGENIAKYGVNIGRSSQVIAKGSWVHIHNLHSLYDERSSHLDTKTGVPRDIVYE